MKKLTDVQLANRMIALLNGQTAASAINVLSNLYVHVAGDSRNEKLLTLSIHVLKTALATLEAKLAAATAQKTWPSHVIPGADPKFLKVSAAPIVPSSKEKEVG